MALAADYTLPSVYDVPRIPGVDTGVPGGIAQYGDESGDPDERNTADGVDITQSPYNCDPTGVADCSTAINTAILDIILAGVFLVIRSSAKKTA